MNSKPFEREIIGENEEYFDDGSVEERRDYVRRKRRADLSNVVREIIETELSDIEKQVVLSMDIDKDSARKLSKKLGISETQIYRIRSRAEDKLSCYLKYVLKYCDKFEEKLTPLEYKKIKTESLMNNSPAKNLCHRLRKLMAKESIDIEMLYKSLKLSKRSIDEIIKGIRLPDANELLTLSYFFKTSADYILKGESI